MPNRILKESICTSPNTDELTAEEEVFFYRILVNCDDFGRFEARPTVLRARCFPLKIDKIKDAQIEKWLQSLVRHKHIIVYSVGGLKYLQVTTWEAHQQVRAKRSKYPALDSTCNYLITDDNICPRNPIQSNPIQSEYLSESESYMVKQEVLKNFLTFWESYPRKVAKQDAEKAFLKIKPDLALLTVIMDAVERFKNSADWQKDGGKFIPHPATFLHGKRWEDEIGEQASGPRSYQGNPSQHPAGAFTGLE